MKLQTSTTGRSPVTARSTSTEYLVEAHVARGLEGIAAEEIGDRFGRQIRLRPAPASEQKRGALRYPYGAIRFGYTGDPRALLELRTVLAVHLVRHFPVPRPRALLGDAYWRAVLGQLTTVRAMLPFETYKSFYLSAAGSESAVMRRLAEQIAQQTGLREASHEGDLHIGLRRAAGDAEGWDLFVRMSPRPLTTRGWRVCNFHGALNAAVAHAMARLTRPDPGQVFLNAACGSGTLLIERLAAGAARRVIGCDIDERVLECASANVTAAGFSGQIELHKWDAVALPLPDASVDVVAADLPFGNRLGSHRENMALYPAILAEAGRVATPAAQFVLITHEVRLTEKILAGSGDWATEQSIQVTLGGLNPRIFVLRRPSAAEAASG